MTEISAGSPCFTLVITIQIPPGRHDELLAHFVQTAKDHSKRPGFISCTVHSSADRTQIAEYIQWESREAWQAMLDSPEGSEHVEEFRPRSNAGIYEVHSVHERAGSVAGLAAGRPDRGPMTGEVP